MSSYIIPFIFLALFCYSKYKKVNTYDTFVKGAKKSIPLVVDIFPYIATIMIAVALLRVSGITSMLAYILSPIFNFLGIPTELIELVLLRPFTGSGSYGILNDAFMFDVPQYGQFSVHMGINNKLKVQELRELFDVKDYDGDFLGNVYILSKANPKLLENVNY